MPTAPPLSRPSARLRSRQIGSAVAIIAAIVVALALLAFISSMLTGPDRIDLAVQNPTAYDLNVKVRGTERGSVNPLGVVGSDSTREFTGVIDQGETWWFEFSYGGVLAAEVEVPRAELQAGPVAVPLGAGDVLEEAGISPTPR